MSSDKPASAGNQQGSRAPLDLSDALTPQRPHAELLAVGAEGLEVYLQGALKDGTYNASHGTHRFGQSDVGWLRLIQQALRLLGHRSWIYREGSSRNFWVLETTAPFLSTEFDRKPLIGVDQGLHYVRGYFDAEGGMPRSAKARLYFQLSQKNRESLENVRDILESSGVRCGLLHNPSSRVDPDYWRFYVRSVSHFDFIVKVGSWHPRKRQLMIDRMKIWSTPHGDMGSNVNKVAVRERAAGSPPF